MQNRYACGVALLLMACQAAPGAGWSARASADDDLVATTSDEPSSAASESLAQPIVEASTPPAPDAAEEDVPPLHPAGQRMAVVSAYYGVPILQRALFWDGNGEVDDFGAAIHNFWFLGNGFALGTGLVGSKFLRTDSDAYALELQGLMRLYVAETRRLGLFLEGGGGWLQATKPVPEDGTVWNFTFEFGPGLDVPLGGGKSFLVGADFHHLSNALGHDNPRNPSQNEGRFWIGLAFDW